MKREMVRQLEPEDPISLRARAFVIATLARATADAAMIEPLRRLESALLDAARLVVASERPEEWRAEPAGR
jgi:hypothetical protein